MRDTDEEPEAEEPSLRDRVESHAIAQSVNRLIRRLHDIRWSAKAFIPLAGQVLEKSYDAAREKLDTAEALLDGDDESQKAIATKSLLRSIKNLQRLESSELIHILESGLFMSAFSSFDAFTGELLSAVYDLKPELYNNINKSVSISDLLKYENLNDIKSIVLANEIDSFRRDSYVDQFKALENRFGLKLKEFDEWPMFVEATQRRNLLTHCDGYVTKQYVLVCESEGFKFDDKPEVGEMIGVGADYFFRTTEIIMGTGLMLGQTLWRKIAPDEIEIADEHINNTVYDFLEREEWDLASTFGKYAFSLRNRSTPVFQRLAAVNYSIALKNSDKTEEMNEVVESMDWSDTALDFELAKAVLTEDYKSAVELMSQIGKEGKFLDESSYHSWPLFRDFVGTSEFRESYENIYGHPFVSELKKIAADTDSKAEDHIKEEVSELEREMEESEIEIDNEDGDGDSALAA